MFALTTADEKRATAFWLALSGGAVTAVLIVWSSLQIREPAHHQGRGPASPLRAYLDVWSNSDARLLLAVLGIESLGMATLGVLGPFFAQYVTGSESLYPVLLISYFVPTVAVVPIALPLSRLLGKKSLWAGAMGLSCISSGSCSPSMPATSC